MKSTLLAVFLLTLLNTFSQNNTGAGGNTLDGSYEIYRTMSPLSTAGNRKVWFKLRDSIYVYFHQDSVAFKYLSGSGNRLVISTPSGRLKNIPYSTFATSSSLNSYLLISDTTNKWQKKGTYLTSYTETDPMWLASPSSGITGTSITNWNMSFGWGNHSSAGYLTTALASSTYQPLIGYVPYNGFVNPNGYISQTTADSRYALMTDTFPSGRFMTSSAATNSINSINSNMAGKVDKSSQITINGVAQDLSASRTWTVGDVTSASLASTLTAYTNTANLNTLLAGKLSSEVDGSVTNEIQSVSKNVYRLSLSNGGGSVSITDADSSATNELQSLSLVGQQLSISSGNSVTLPSASLPNTGTAGTYGRVTTDAQGRVIAGKRQETYSGTTDALGNYTVTFPVAYSIAPNIQAQLIGGTDLTFFRVASVSTTGFTVYAFTRSSITSLPIIGTLTGALLGTAGTALLGGSIDVLITER